MPRVLGMRKITSSQRVDDTAMVHKWLVNEHGSKAAEFGDRATVRCTVQIETGRWIHLQCCCFGDNLSCYLSLCENCDRELFWLPVWIDRCVLDWVFHLPSSPICSAQKHILSLWHGVHNFVLFILFPCRTNHSIYAFVAWLTMTILYTPLGYPTKSDTNVRLLQQMWRWVRHVGYSMATDLNLWFMLCSIGLTCAPNAAKHFVRCHCASRQVE